MGREKTFVPPWKVEGPHFWMVMFIRAPRERVFEYLTKGEHTKKYYFGMPIHAPEKVGEPVWFGTEDESPIDGKVLEFDPPERFAHTFSFRHQPDDPTSKVEFTLFAHGPEVTALILRHHGFRGYDSGTLADVSSGWPQILSSLKTLLETGEPLEIPEGRSSSA